MLSQKKTEVDLVPLLQRAGRRYRRRLKEVQNRFSPEAVHDLRVETRRLLALCELLKGLRAGPPLGKLRKCLKKRLEMFSRLRDVQVQIEMFRGGMAESGFPVAAVTLILPQLLEEERGCIRKLSKKTRLLRPGPVVSKLREMESAVSGVPAERLFGLLEKTESRAARKFAAICPEEPARFHKARVALKRLRYQAEILDPWVSTVTEKRLQKIRAQQDALGEIQDLDTWIHALRRGLEKGRYPHHVTSAILEQSVNRLGALCAKFCRDRRMRVIGGFA
jgi:CHAD domain-containing protein